MDSDEALYKALIDKRNELREESKPLGGRRSTVCTDDACMEMVRLRPQKESDFEMIRGIG